MLLVLEDSLLFKRVEILINMISEEAKKTLPLADSPLGKSSYISKNRADSKLNVLFKAINKVIYPRI